MEKFEITDEVLLDYIDGALSTGKKELVEGACESDPALRKRLAELQKTDQWLSQMIESAPATFTTRVWERLQQSPGLESRYSFNSLLLLLGALATVVIGSYFISDSVMQLHLDWSFEGIGNYVRIPEVSLNQGIQLKLITQVLLFGLAMLALLFLDKAVLRPYFKRRRADLSGM